MSAQSNPPERPFNWLRFLLFVGVGALISAGIVALLVNIFERKQEARNPFYRVVQLTDTTEDPAVWGKNFPLEYDAYRRTVDQVRTRFGGSEAPEPPTPRSRREAEVFRSDPSVR